MFRCFLCGFFWQFDKNRTLFGCMILFSWIQCVKAINLLLSGQGFHLCFDSIQVHIFKSTIQTTDPNHTFLNISVLRYYQKSVELLQMVFGQWCSGSDNSLCNFCCSWAYTLKSYTIYGKSKYTMYSLSIVYNRHFRFFDICSKEIHFSGQQSNIYTFMTQKKKLLS